MFSKIFSLKKERRRNTKTNLVDVRLILRFLFLKLSIKLYDYPNTENYDNLLSQYIFYSWETLKDSSVGFDFDRNMQNFELAAFSTGVKLPRQIKQIFISMCIEDKAYSKAFFLIDRYIRDFGEEDLYEYGIIANFMLENNLSNNETIKKSARLYNLLLKNEKENLLANYIKNKSIAVVGNGPYEIGGG